MKCIGNCATCEVAPESKAACCAVQTLKNIIEVKALLMELRVSRDPFSNVPDLEQDNDSEPTVLGSEKES